MEKFFYKLSGKSTKSDMLRSLIKTAPESMYRLNHNLFYLIEVSKNLFNDEPIYDLINRFNGKINIFKTNPMNFYTWHVDEERTCSINMILENTNSHCLFGTTIDIANKSIVELKHEYDTYFLCNLKEEHCILNFTGTRYLLSIGFYHNSYSELLEYCKLNNL